MNRTIWLLYITMFAVTSVFAQSAEDIVQWSARVNSKAGVRKNTPFIVNVSAKIKPGWHIYSLTQPEGGPTPTSIKLSGTQPFALDGKPKGTPPRKIHDDNFQMETELYENSATFMVPIKETAVSTGNLMIDVRFQTCSETLCLPPTTEHVSVPIDSRKR